MYFTLEVLPAFEGDCLLLHWGSVSKLRLAVIDGGPAQTFETSLRPRLIEILEQSEKENLDIDFVLVSHVDADHITGIRKLYAQKRRAMDAHRPGDCPFELNALWYNCFNDIIGDSADKYYKQFKNEVFASVDGQIGENVVSGIRASLGERGQIADDKESLHLAHDIGHVLAGHADARTLRDHHKFLYDKQKSDALNSPFGGAGAGTLITADVTPNPISRSGLTIHIVGPARSEIEALQRDFDKYLKKKNISPEALLAAYADKSIPNLSSIVCLVEYKDKRILLTGDARGDKILVGLEAAGLLENGKLLVDVLKVPHHGSDRNVDESFFSKIIADTYVFSADGKHGNPDRTTIEWLTTERGKNAKYEMVFTYPLDHIDGVREEDADTWSRSDDSIEAYLQSLKKQGFLFGVRAGGRSRIELGEEIPW